MEKCWCGNDKLEDYSEDYYRCCDCNTLISKRDFCDDIYDVKSEEQDLYGKAYWAKEMLKASGKETLSEVIDYYISDRVLYWTKYILKYIMLGGKIAEVGCGLGALQYVLRRMDYEQIGFELSPEICEYDSKTLDIKMQCGTFIDNGEKYDAVLAYDLFEHLSDPDGFLDACSSSLNENGIICFQTPCFDPMVSYEDILQNNLRFREQLKAEQHIFLYSKESMTKILEEKGFTNIVFEPAYFGDDYDMFLFASKHPIQINAEKEIDEFLNTRKCGRLIKNLIVLFEQKRSITAMYSEADTDRLKRQEQINELESLLAESESDRTARQDQIKELTSLLTVSEADRAARQDQIKELTSLLTVSEADRAARQDQINELTELLAESESDRASRQDQINELTKFLTESESDRASRQDQINELTRLLAESEADRASRQEQIITLTALLKESEEDRKARFDQINTFSALLKESEEDRKARLEQIETLNAILRERENKD